MLVAVLVVGGLVTTTASAQQADVSASDIQYAATVTQGSGITQATVIWQKFLNRYSSANLVQDGQFGPLSAAAAKVWQASRNLVADGVLGAMSRASAVAQINAGVTNPVGGTFPAGCSSNSGFSVTTGLSCASSFPAGCTSSSGFSVTTGQPCAGTPNNLPAGCSSTAGFSSTTGASCSGGTVVNANGEGSLTVTYDAVPANNLAVSKGENKAVLALKLKATTGSNMNVSRLWLDINKRIWLSADSASLMDGSTVIATVPLSVSTVTETTVGSAWQLQFNSLNVNVAAGTTKIITLMINRPTLTSNNDSVTVAATSTIRATDSAGISNTYTLTARTINLTSTTAATTGTLTATLASTTPVAQSVSGLSTTVGDLTPIRLLDVDLKATDGAINVTDISGTLTAAGTCTAAQCVSSTELRDPSLPAGSQVLASVTGAATFDFSALSVDIAAGTTKHLQVWAQVNHIASSYVVKGDSIYAVVNNVDGTTGPTFTAADITPTVTGNTQTFFQYAPTFALVNTTTNPTSASQADGSATGEFSANFALSFSVTAPSDSDIYVNATDGSLCGGTYPVTKIAAACSNTAIGGVMTTGSVVVSGASSKGTGTLATWDKVSAGTTRIFTITGHTADGGSAAGFTYMSLATNGIQWTDTDNITISGAASTEQTWGLTDFKTPTVYVTT